MSNSDIPDWKNMNRPELVKLLRKTVGMAAAIEMNLYMIDKEDADGLLRGVMYLKEYQRLVETSEESEEDSDEDELEPTLDEPDLS